MWLSCELLKEPVEKWRNVGGHNLLELMYQAGKLLVYKKK
jgi:hypothetical protein